MSLKQPALTNLMRQAWYELAQEANDRAGRAEPRQRERVYDELARERGLHVQSIKRALTGYKFVNEIRVLDPERARRLRALPVAAVNTIARWADRDRTAAFDAIARYEAGELSTRKLDAEERAARSRDGDFQAQLTRYLGLYELDAYEAAFLHLGKDWRSEPVSPFDHFGVGPFTRCFGHRKTGERCLLLVPGPFEHHGEWDKNRNAIMLHARGASSMGYRVMVAVPEGAGIPALLEAWLAAFPVTAERITILETDLRQLPKDWDGKDDAAD